MRNGALGTAQVTGGVAGIIVHVVAGRGGGVIDGAGSPLVQRQSAAGGGGIASIAVGVVATQIGIDASGLITHVDKLVGAVTGRRPLGVIRDGGNQRSLILGAVARRVNGGVGIVQRPVVAVGGNMPDQGGVVALNLIVLNGDLCVVKTRSAVDLRFQRAAFVHHQVVTLGEGAAVELEHVAVAAAALCRVGIERIQGRRGGHRVAATRLIIGGSGFGGLYLVLDPAQEGVAVGCGTAVSGQGDGIVDVGGLRRGIGAAHLSKLNRHLLARHKVDTHRHIRGGNHGEHVAAASNGGAAAEDGIATHRITGLGGGGDGLAAHRHGAVGGIVGAGAHGIGGTAALSGGRIVVRRNVLIKQQEGQFGIVHEHVTGAGDRLNGVVTTQFPGVNGVLFHPLQQNRFALHNAGRAPHIVEGTVVLRTTAPADVNVQHDTSHIAANLLTQSIGVIEITTLTIGGVAAGRVFADRSGTEHHNVGLALGIAVAAAVTLAVWPAMLTVPGVTAIPGRADGIAGIERGDGAAVVLTVGVLEQASGGIIGRGIVQIAVHQLVQFAKQRTVRYTAVGGGAGIGGQSVIGDAVAGIKILRHRGQESGQFLALAPVVDVIAAVDVVYRRRLYRQDDQTAQHADHQHQRGQYRQQSFLSGFHSKTSDHIKLFMVNQNITQIYPFFNTFSHKNQNPSGNRSVPMPRPVSGKKWKVEICHFLLIIYGIYDIMPLYVVLWKISVIFS